MKMRLQGSPIKGTTLARMSDSAGLRPMAARIGQVNQLTVLATEDTTRQELIVMSLRNTSRLNIQPPGNPGSLPLILMLLGPSRLPKAGSRIGRLEIRTVGIGTRTKTITAIVIVAKKRLRKTSTPKIANR